MPRKNRLAEYPTCNAMSVMMNARNLLVHLPHSYTGRGPAESCVRLLEGFAAEGWDVTLHLARARRQVRGAQACEAVGGWARHLPYRWIAGLAEQRLERRMANAIDRAAPGSVAWLWPDTPVHLVQRAKARGVVTVREMINSPLAHAKRLLDAAYTAEGMRPTHGISDERARLEAAELALYDFVFASNLEVERALQALGIDAARILPTTFGWSRQRFDASRDDPATRPDGFRAVFVGTLNVRKGVPVLLDAWMSAGVKGELLLAGPIAEAIRERVHAAARSDPSIRILGPVSDVAALYRSCDVFVFPTIEEGGPQVTYEAAACGLPAITTPMGAARLTRDGVTGLIVEPGDHRGLGAALKRMADDGPSRAAMAEAAQAAAAMFEYLAVGRSRGRMLAEVVGRAGER